MATTRVPTGAGAEVIMGFRPRPIADISFATIRKTAVAVGGNKEIVHLIHLDLVSADPVHACRRIRCIWTAERDTHVSELGSAVVFDRSF